MASQIEKIVEQKIEMEKSEPKVEVLGKMSEISRAKNGGSDQNPNSRQS